MVCYGINAPACLFKLLADPFYRVDMPPPSIFGVEFETIFFFCGVGVVWFLVGRSLDGRILRSRSVLKSTAHVFFDSLLLIVAAVLLLAAMGPFYGMDMNNPTGSAIQSALTIVWSLWLSFVGSRGLWTSLHKRSSFRQA